MQAEAGVAVFDVRLCPAAPTGHTGAPGWAGLRAGLDLAVIGLRHLHSALPLPLLLVVLHLKEEE